MTDILDLIDGAPCDYGTSTDAMRWTPEPDEVAKQADGGWVDVTEYVRGTTPEWGSGPTAATLTLDNSDGRLRAVRVSPFRSDRHAGTSGAGRA